jgi:lysophospholipase L1-like esterase
MNRRNIWTSSIYSPARRRKGWIAVFAAAVWLLSVSSAQNEAMASAPPSNWTGTWAIAQVRDNSGRTFTDCTLRQIVRISVGGESVRLKLSNLFGTQPLRIENVHLALRKSGSAIVPSSDHQLRFGGSTSLVIPAGASAFSDSVTFDVPALAELAVSIYLPGTTGPATFHGSAHQISYVEAGDASSAPQMTNAETTKSMYFLAGLDVEGPSLRGSVVTLGASITEGYAAADDTDHRWPDQLALRLAGQGISIGVLNLGISGNRLLVDGSGESAENRFERDILQQPDVRWVIFSDDPINDLGNKPSPSGEALIAGLERLIARSHKKNIRFICSTLTPFEGANYWTPEEEKERQKVNSFIRGGHSACDGIVDQDAATHDLTHPTQYLPAYDNGDHLHPNDAGHRAIANAIDLNLFTPGPNTSERERDEVAPIYLRQNTSSVETPERSLKAFSRIHLKPHETKTVSFNVPESELAIWNAEGNWVAEPGTFTVWAGGSSHADLTQNSTLKP